MTISSIVNQFRLDIDDLETPGDGDDEDSLWKDSEIIRYLDLSHKEFARRTRLLRDRTTASIVTLTLDAENPWLPISPKIIKIVRAKSPTGKLMSLKEFHQMDSGSVDNDYGIQFVSRWEQTVGEPITLVTDMEKDMVRAVPSPAALASLTLAADLSGAAETAVVVNEVIPTNAPAAGRIRILLDSGAYAALPYTSYTGSTFTIDATDFSADNATGAKTVFVSNAWTINLMVDRLPLNDIDSLSDTALLEFTEPEHEAAIILYMMHLAYLKQDADTYDPQLSDRMLQQFLAAAGTLKRDMDNVRQRVGTVRYGGL